MHKDLSPGSWLFFHENAMLLHTLLHCCTHDIRDFH